MHSAMQRFFIAVLSSQHSHRARCLQMAGCSSDNLLIDGPWKWLIQAFALHFNVAVPYTLMAHLRWVLRPEVATLTSKCFRIIGLLMASLLEKEKAGAISQDEVGGAEDEQARKGGIQTGPCTCNFICGALLVLPLPNFPIPCMSIRPASCFSSSMIPTASFKLPLKTTRASLMERAPAGSARTPTTWTRTWCCHCRYACRHAHVLTAHLICVLVPCE